MDEWEAKYKALCAGVTDPVMIENAEKLVKAGIALSTATMVPLHEVMWQLLHTVVSLREDKERGKGPTYGTNPNGHQ